MTPSLIIIDFPLIDRFECRFRQNRSANYLNIVTFKDIIEFILTYYPTLSFDTITTEDYYEWGYERAKIDSGYIDDFERYLLDAYEEVSEFVYHRILNYMTPVQYGDYRFLQWLDSNSMVMEHVGKHF